jgi:hypothetical protein
VEDWWGMWLREVLWEEEARPVANTCGKAKVAAGIHQRSQDLEIEFDIWSRREEGSERLLL